MGALPPRELCPNGVFAPTGALPPWGLCPRGSFAPTATTPYMMVPPPANIDVMSNNPNIHYNPYVRVGNKLILNLPATQSTTPTPENAECQAAASSSGSGAIGRPQAETTSSRIPVVTDDTSRTQEKAQTRPNKPPAREIYKKLKFASSTSTVPQS